MIEDRRIISQLNLEIPLGQKLETTVTSIEQRPRYYRIGNGLRNTFMGKYHEPIDAIDQMSEMSAQELWTLKKIKDNLILLEVRTTKGIKFKTSCKSVVIFSDLTNAEQQKFKAGYKKLNAKNLIKRIKKEHYILNPDFFIPEFYDEERELFDSL